MTDKYQFDYTNQAWLKNGVYVRCQHQKCINLWEQAKSIYTNETWPWATANKMAKDICFGTRHAGEQPNLTAAVH